MAILKKEFEEDDPMELIKVLVPGDERRMAECFIEEFMFMGYSNDQLLSLFKNPFYAGVNRIYSRHGEAWVRDLIRSVRGEWTA